MSSEECWELTQREFAARESVYQAHQESDYKRWCIERVERMNAPHFTRKDKRAYDLHDFMPGLVEDVPLDGAERARALARRLAGVEAPRNPAFQAERDRIDFERERLRDTRMDKLMRSGNFDDSILPAWARMTPEEKAKGGIS